MTLTNEQLHAISNNTRIAVKSLETQLSAAQDKIIELESSLEKLKNFINRLNLGGAISNSSTSASEIAEVLTDWAQD